VKYTSLIERRKTDDDYDVDDDDEDYEIDFVISGK
jgi:hypothetical protein